MYRARSAEGGRARACILGEVRLRACGRLRGRTLLRLKELDDQQVRGYAKHSRGRRAAVCLASQRSPFPRPRTPRRPRRSALARPWRRSTSVGQGPGDMLEPVLAATRGIPMNL